MSKRSIIGSSIAVIVLLAVSVPALEELYRAYAFVPAVRNDLLRWPILEKAVAEFQESDVTIPYYFASGVLAQSCARSSFGCFEWKDYPNVITVITEGAGLSRSPAVLLFRKCPAVGECSYLNDQQAAAVPIDKQQFLEFLSERKTITSCTEVPIRSTAVTPLLYRTQYCSDVNVFGEYVTSINVYAKVAQPYYAMALSDIWFRSELSATLHFVKRSVVAGKGWSAAEVLEAGSE